MKLILTPYINDTAWRDAYIIYDAVYTRRSIYSEIKFAIFMKNGKKIHYERGKMMLFNTLDDAMSDLDQYLIEQNHTLLNNDQWEKLKLII
jgi:hypothetical protein